MRTALEVKTCPSCKGSGFIDEGYRDPETGYADGPKCVDCDGEGTLEPRTCSQCQLSDENEDNDGGLCDACKSENERDDAADRAYDMLVEE